MHIFVQEINKRASFPPILCDILLKSLHFVKEERNPRGRHGNCRQLVVQDFFFRKGCQVVKMPMYKRIASSLTVVKVVRGCQNGTWS